MARKKHNEEPAPESAPGAPRVIVANLGAPHASFSARLRATGAIVRTVTSPANLDDMGELRACDVVLVTLDRDASPPHSLLAWARLRGDQPALVLVQESPTMEFACACMRAGVADLIDAACPMEELRTRLRAAADRTDRARRLASRRVRATREAKAAKRSFERSRRALEEQMGGVCAQLAGSYRELGEQLRGVAMASELETLLRQELDVESLLRTTLEFLLRKVGPTNAAIFLPDSSGDWSLGAYVNYDCPRDSAERMLDSLCAVVAPSCQERGGMRVVRDLDELNKNSSTPLHWMEDHCLAVYSCIHDGECIGVLTVFRDAHNPWQGQAAETVRLVGELFGGQLHRALRTHNRHVNKSGWSAADDDAGLAA